MSVVPPSAPAEGCLHCGDPVPAPDAYPVRFEGRIRPTCCPGCQAVASTVLAAGLDEFYRGHRVPGRLPEGLTPQIAAPSDHALYDEPEMLERYVRRRTGDADGAPRCEVDLALEGMHCGACVWLLERGLGAMPGVQSARINFASERAQLIWDPTRQPLSALLATIARLGYRAWPFDAARREQSVRRQGRVLLQRLFVAGLVAMQAMMFALPEYLYGPEAIEAEYRGLLRAAGLLLILPVLLYSAAPFFAGAWRDLRARRPGMDVPVAIGLSLAFIGSVRAIITGVGDVYFDSIAMFTALLLAARYVEWRARRRAAATIDALAASAPETARRIGADGQTQIVPVARLRPGDEILVHTGEAIAADARLLDAAAEVDQSLLTGESQPVVFHAGDWVPGGALLAGAPVRLQVQRASAESTLSVIARLAEQGASDKPAMARMADRIAAVFVPTILGLALLTGLVWAWLEPGAAWPRAIAVLVVSCPCALSLATPTAMAAAHAGALRRQLLLARGDVLETVAGITDVVFDKTGTLTEGRPALIGVDTAAHWSREQVLAIAAALEQGAAHPLADAIRDAAGVPGDAIRLSERAQRAGAGLAARLDDALKGPQAVFLGSAAWCGLVDARAAREALGVHAPDDSLSEVWLSMAPWAGGWAQSLPSNQGATATMAGEPPGQVAVLARFTFSDRVRESVPAVLRALADDGIGVHLLSGDRAPVVASVAASLGISQARGEADPQGKQAYVQALQEAGRRVLMVGDGINDTPVLASADVSVAFGRPTMLTQSAADVVVMRARPEAITDLLEIGRRTRRVIHQNLSWAFVYNLLAIPLAALGWVAPWLAAIGMACSSLVVVFNAARLLRGAPPMAARTRARVTPAAGLAR
ncbi:MAG: heavy metal translocating P-type ATPase [Burkholderiaceae bacterium]